MIRIDGRDAESGKVWSSENVISARELLRAIVRARNHYRVTEIAITSALGTSVFAHVGAGCWEWVGA